MYFISKFYIADGWGIALLHPLQIYIYENVWVYSFSEYFKKHNADTVVSTAHFSLSHPVYDFLDGKPNLGWDDSNALVFYVDLREVENQTYKTGLGNEQFTIS